MNFFGNGHQNKFKLCLGFNHSSALITDMFKSSCNINFFCALGHAVENHINQAVCSSSTDTITAVNNNRARSSSVRFVHF
ncbi:hypothetical protein X975_10786, partial [Stegodyphus mimosarum]